MLECPSLYNKKIHFSFFAFYILSFFIWALCLLYTVFTTSILKEGFNATVPLKHDYFHNTISFFDDYSKIGLSRKEK